MVKKLLVALLFYSPKRTFFIMGCLVIMLTSPSIISVIQHKDFIQSASAVTCASGISCGAGCCSTGQTCNPGPPASCNDSQTPLKPVVIPGIASDTRPACGSGSPQVDGDCPDGYDCQGVSLSNNPYYNRYQCILRNQDPVVVVPPCNYNGTCDQTSGEATSTCPSDCPGAPRDDLITCSTGNAVLCGVCCTAPSSCTNVSGRYECKAPPAPTTAERVKDDQTNTCSSCKAQGSAYLCTSKSLWNTTSTTCSPTDNSSSGIFGYGNTTCQACDSPTQPPSSSEKYCSSTPDSKTTITYSCSDGGGSIVKTTRSVGNSPLASQVTVVSCVAGTCKNVDNACVTCTPPTVTTGAPTAPVTPTTGLTCDPVKDGKIDTLDFQFWKDEFLKTKTTKDADCFKRDGEVNTLDFQVWKDIAILKTKQPF